MSRTIYFLSCIIMISILCSCTKNVDLQIEQEESADSAHEKITLKIVQSLISPQRTAKLEQLIDQYEADHPNISIQLITPQNSTPDKTILTMLEENREVDIVEVRDITAHEYASRGLLASLEKNISHWGNYALLSENARLMARDVGNITYYIPSSLYQVQLYYRKDWFDARALQVPETWEQLYYVGKQLTKPMMGQYGFAFRGGPGAAYMLSSMIQDYNGDDVGTNDSMFNLDGTTIFKDERAQEALELYRKLYTEISHPDSMDWGFTEHVQAFMDGKAAMLIQDSDVIPMFIEKLKDMEWATAPLPSGPQGISHFNVGAAGWGIALQSKHREEAWRFIVYLSTMENNRDFADAASVISIYNNALNEEKYATGPYAPYILMNNDPIHYRGVKRPSHYMNYNEFFKMSTERGRFYLQGQLTADMLLSEFDEFWQLQRQLQN
ncbi:sugar ABC transporter substrate-binding protein [Paenibacillus sp. FSL H8-0548]|uniref:ABC transporter substrate-binding protein n=1 Tax=Paenibacillus sp. FSL H8-0548 TaxID=1920422 RepID=UPI0015C36E61|nr:sugar ABC transporter substrate-binding protein [Paenibacillus sp. FSL H8-0548]